MSQGGTPALILNGGCCFQNPSGLPEFIVDTIFVRRRTLSFQHLNEISLYHLPVLRLDDIERNSSHQLVLTVTSNANKFRVDIFEPGTLYNVAADQGVVYAQFEFFFGLHAPGIVPDEPFHGNGMSAGITYYGPAVVHHALGPVGALQAIFHFSVFILKLQGPRFSRLDFLTVKGVDTLRGFFLR